MFVAIMKWDTVEGNLKPMPRPFEFDDLRHESSGHVQIQ